MKNFKFALAISLATTLGLAITSFTVKSFNANAFARKCYTINIEIYISSDLNSNSGTAVVDFLNINNWDPTSVTSIDPTPCDGPQYVCGICFNEGVDFTNLQDALDKTEDYIETLSTPYGFAHQTDYEPVTNKFITFYEREDAIQP